MAKVDASGRYSRLVRDFGDTEARDPSEYHIVGNSLRLARHVSGGTSNSPVLYLRLVGPKRLIKFLVILVLSSYK